MPTLTSFPPDTVVYVVQDIGQRPLDAAQESAPSGTIREVEPGSRPPAELGEIVETATTGADGRTVLTTGSGDGDLRSGLPRRRYFAVGQLPSGSWQRVSFS